MQNYFETTQQPVFAVDFDYFRIPQGKWGLMLTRLKQMGATALTITVPWGFHEFNRGAIDLNGATLARRDIMGLLDLCSTLNLHCILNPGPYSNSGVLGDGLPFWLLKDPDTLETNLPAAVEGWYQAMSAGLSSRQWPAGPIIALDLNCEPGKKRQPTYSKQLTEVKWRIWLRKRYDGIEALNAAYGTDHRTVNDVKFPRAWSGQDIPLEKDAQEFLEKVRIDAETHYHQIMVDAGWQIPIYPSAREIHPNLPPIQYHSLANDDKLDTLKPDHTILCLQQSIQVDPDPFEVGQAPWWANDAPIRADGSLRQKFRTVRQYLWSHTLADAGLKGETLQATFAATRLVTGQSDASLNIEVGAGVKPSAYRLRLNGELITYNELKTRQGKLRGRYPAEDEVDQTDLILILTNPTASLSEFPLAYLAGLLTAQAQTLTRCARQAEKLGNLLTVSPPAPDTPPTEHPSQTLHTLEEARRGLREADAALRKAMSSIGGLEDGFATILDRNSAKVIPQPAPEAVSIAPELFEGRAGDILIEIGDTCAKIAPRLNSAAKAVQQAIEKTGEFTVEQYRQSYAAAVAAAQAAQEPLLDIIAQLRLEIGSEKLPLLLWRIHDQVCEILEALRWGVLRK